MSPLSFFLNYLKLLFLAADFPVLTISNCIFISFASHSAVIVSCRTVGPRNKVSGFEKRRQMIHCASHLLFLMFKVFHELKAVTIKNFPRGKTIKKNAREKVEILSKDK